MALFGPPNIDRLVSSQDIPGLIRASEYERDPEIRRQAVEALGLMPDEQSLAPLIRRLLDSELAVREAAAKALGQIGDPRAIDALATVVEGEQEDLSPAAIEALGYIGTDEAVPTLILSLSDEPLVDVTIEALARTGAPAVVPLMGLIDGKDRVLKERAEKALHGMDPQAALDLAPLVNDRKSMERFVAARALGEIGSAEAISVLVTALGSTDIQLQHHVLSGLTTIGTNATPALVAALESESRLQQRGAIDALGRLADPMAAGPLAKVIAGSNPVLRDLALQALARVPDDAALESIVAFLDHESWQARRQVAVALGMAKRSDGVPALLKLLSDENQTVQRSAAASLGQLGWRPNDTTEPAAAASYAVALGQWDRVEKYGADAVAPIMAYLAENAWEQRRRPTEMLVSIGEPSVEPLIGALRSPDRGLRHSAAFALGLLGDARAVEPLIAAMSDKMDDVRASAARSLGQLKDPAAVPVLAEHLSDIMLVRGPAATALVSIGEEGTPVLLEALESEDAGVRAIVADALGDTASLEAVHALIGHLTDEAEPVRQASVRGLVHLDDLAVEPLYGQLDAEDELVRISVAAVFGQIGKPECIPALYTLVRDATPAVQYAAAAALEKLWLARTTYAEPMGYVAEMFVMTFTDATEDDELQSWLISEAFGDLTTASPDLQRVHTRIMVDQSLLHEVHEASPDFEYAYGPMLNRFMAWIEAEGGLIEEWETRFCHREITTGDEPPVTHYVFLYYLGGEEPEVKADEDASYEVYDDELELNEDEAADEDDAPTDTESDGEAAPADED